MSQPIFEAPKHDCDICPRLAGFHIENQGKFPNYHNGPVPAFGGLEAEFLVLGLAPGLHGANQTGRPFTGDYAGDVLYPALIKHGFGQGKYQAKPDDGVELINARISNAVRCVPPQNKPTPEEIRGCNPFLVKELAAMPNLKVILTLGTISHQAVLRAKGQKLSAYKFAHGAVHELDGVKVLNSYHTSRYNINTNRLTVEMFDAIIRQAKGLLAA